MGVKSSNDQHNKIDPFFNKMFMQVFMDFNYIIIFQHNLSKIML